MILLTGGGGGGDTAPKHPHQRGARAVSHTTPRPRPRSLECLRCKPPEIRRLAS